MSPRQMPQMYGRDECKLPTPNGDHLDDQFDPTDTLSSVEDIGTDTLSSMSIADSMENNAEISEADPIDSTDDSLEIVPISSGDEGDDDDEEEEEDEDDEDEDEEEEEEESNGSTQEDSQSTDGSLISIHIIEDVYESPAGYKHSGCLDLEDIRAQQQAAAEDLKEINSLQLLKIETDSKRARIAKQTGDVPVKTRVSGPLAMQAGPCVAQQSPTVTDSKNDSPPEEGEAAPALGTTPVSFSDLDVAGPSGVNRPPRGILRYTRNEVLEGGDAGGAQMPRLPENGGDSDGEPTARRTRSQLLLAAAKHNPGSVVPSFRRSVNRYFPYRRPGGKESD